MGYKNPVLYAFNAHKKIMKTIKSCETDVQLNNAQHMLSFFGRIYDPLIDKDSIDKYRIEQIGAVQLQRQEILRKCG